ncbi:hypothetical protein [Nocardia brasiliensis]|uniref:hypothetical protein n=1 Tax=Nocardia brasiliensis TaxID=37326 RepID=UPI002454D067|nr:hypothetical protein [Nocardia brasiliensis]
MQLGRCSAFSLLFIVALGIAEGTAAARPSEVRDEIVATGIDQTVGYQSVLVEQGRGIVTTVERGIFEVALDGSKVSLISDDGVVLTEIPLNYQFGGRTLEVAEQVSDDRRKLVLSAKPGAKEVGQMRDVDANARLVGEINKNVVGMVVGGLLGGLLGAVIGLGFFSILTGPVGMVVGAVAGAYIMGGQPFAEAVNSVLGGEQ